jgi:hypothetical protein
LAGIPEITTEKDIRQKKIIRTIQVIGFIVVAVNIFWAKLMRRLAL